MTNQKLSVREINAIVRACDGRNVYATEFGYQSRLRIVRARTRRGVMEIRYLCNGKWGVVGTNTVFQVE